MVSWYTCKCPCPGETQLASGVAEGADRCKSGGGNLKSCNTEDEARNTVLNHLTASPYHNMEVDDAKMWKDSCEVEETSMTESEHAAYCNQFRENNETRKRSRVENAEESIKSANALLARLTATLEAGNQGHLPIVHSRAVAIGARSPGGASSSGHWVSPRRHIGAPLPGEFVTMPATEMQSVLDCVGRAIRASRGAEKLASTAAFAFRAEAEALEQSMEHIEAMLERSSGH
jgi:hypothetical protein